MIRGHFTYSEQYLICFFAWLIYIEINKLLLKWRSRRLRPKAHILDDPLGNPNDVLKVLLGPPYGP